MPPLLVQLLSCVNLTIVALNIYEKLNTEQHICIQDIYNAL